MSVPGRRFTIVLALLAVPSWLLGGQDPKPAQDKPTAAFARQGEFLDDAGICKDCHEDEFAAITGGVHQRVPTAAGLHRCETCHGPGKGHSQENDNPALITMPPRLSGTDQRALCAQCHKDQIADHGGPLVELLAAGKKCTDCHKVHQLVGDVPGYHERLSFVLRTAAVQSAEPVGTSRCLACHKEKASSLERGTHRALLIARSLDAPAFDTWHREQACEACHGDGSLHAATNGVARLITRPDAAGDGIETCRQCHADVDPVAFHWKEGHSPLLGAPAGQKITCTTCHRVHSPGDPTRATALAPRDRDARQPRIPMSDAQVTPDSCLPCHEPAYRLMHGTIHEELARLDQPPGHGCVSCHPGASEHVRSGGRKDRVASLRETSAAFQARICMDCHQKDSAVCGYSLGVHERSDVGCVTCHSAMTAPKERRGMQQDSHKACASCHADVALAFRHANRHPVGEAEFTCSSCHDPHRPLTLAPNSARKMSAVCADCHREYRGPHVFNHHADKGEGCLACHVPHGSSNRKMLQTRQSRDLCLACHADLPPFHDQSPGSVYRNCLSCHTQIHGSNRNRFFLR